LYAKRPLCVVEPSFEGLRETYVVHLRLIGKRVVDFLLVIIELFSLGVTADERTSLGSCRFEAGGSIWAKISGRRGCPHQPFFVSQN